MVRNGVVHLWCSYLSERERRALIVAAESIPGIRRVEDHMTPAQAQSRSAKPIDPMKHARMQPEELSPEERAEIALKLTAREQRGRPQSV